MHKANFRRLVPLLLGSLGCFGVQAGTVDLTNAGWVQYGDAISYSLPVNGLEVMSGPGQISMFTKVGLGANGQQSNGVSGMDDAYDTPNPNNIAGFRMADQSDPGNNGGWWDRSGWWDASLASLIGAIKGLPVFFFANNETGSDGKLLEGSDSSLAVWGRIEITDKSGNLVGRFDLTNHHDNSGAAVGYGPPPIGGGAFLGDPSDYTSTGADPLVADFLMSGGKVCLGAAGTPIKCDGSQGQVVRTVEHNLGGDRAAYAVVVPELNMWISGLSEADLAKYAFHMDVRLGCGEEGSFPGTFSGSDKNPKFTCNGDYALNGGDEKIFIGTMDMVQRVPEPGVLALVGIGIIGFAATRRRER